MTRMFVAAISALAFVAGCSGSQTGEESLAPVQVQEAPQGSRLRDLLIPNAPPDTTIAVNKYLWNASLQVLDFMPIESVDPFSGVIVFGYGTPPGGRQSYRAVVLVQDPALDARSLKLSLSTRSGPVTPDTLRAIEDAILSRARQLRVDDSRL